MTKFLYKQIDNSSLIIFRVVFGFLIFLESVGAIFTGWVKRTLIAPEFTFTVIGFEWLQPLPGNGMYFYYTIMGVFGLMVMVGYKYRFSIIAFTLLWTGTYLMQKASYNNHYYLLILISGFMCILPAHKYLSIDVTLKPKLYSIHMPNWAKWIFIAQMAIVYTYGALAKVYDDWLDTTVMSIFMSAKKHYYVIGDALQNSFVHYFLAYGGILFDALIIPLLLIKQTRKIAFCAAIFFHLFNAIVFQVGIFPFLSLAFCLFFYDSKTIHRIFLKRKPFYNSNDVILPKNKTLIISFFTVYFCTQLLLPIRHWFIKGDVLRTEEGHRLSWRMMLRSKHGNINFRVVDKTTGESSIINHRKMLSTKQVQMIGTKPDVIWQFVQRIKNDYKTKGKDIELYAIYSRVAINGKPSQPFINPEIDLTTINWNTFCHSEWILESQIDKRNIN